VTEQMRIDDTVGDGQAETRRQVLELFPQSFGAGFFGFHGFDPRRELQSVTGHGFSRAERKLVPKTKTPRATSGRTFLQFLVYHIIKFSQGKS